MDVKICMVMVLATREVSEGRKVPESAAFVLKVTSLLFFFLPLSQKPSRAYFYYVFTVFLLSF